MRWQSIPKGPLPDGPMTEPVLFESRFDSRCMACHNAIHQGEKVWGLKLATRKWIVWHNLVSCSDSMASKGIMLAAPGTSPNASKGIMLAAPGTSPNARGEQSAKIKSYEESLLDAFESEKV